MTRWEILDKVHGVLSGKYGNGDLRRLRLGVDYKPVQKVVDLILQEEDHISKEIEEHEEAIRKLKMEKEKGEKKQTDLSQTLYPVCEFCHNRLNVFGCCENCNRNKLEELK